jgi:hypothetical protein
LYRAAGFDCGLQQRSVKAEKLRAIGRRAFGKDRYILAGVKQRIDLGVDDFRVLPATASQEDRIGPCRQPADQRPVAYLRLGDEGHRTRGIDGEDIEPRNVIGDDQAAGLDAGQGRVEFDAEDVEQVS